MRRGAARRLVLERRDGASDGMGGRRRGWSEVGVHWGWFRARPVRVSDAAGGPRVGMRYDVTLRAVPVGMASRPLPGDRFREGSRVFGIRAVIDAEADGLWLVCSVDEEVRP